MRAVMLWSLYIADSLLTFLCLSRRSMQRKGLDRLGNMRGRMKSLDPTYLVPDNLSYQNNEWRDIDGIIQLWYGLNLNFLAWMGLPTSNNFPQESLVCKEKFYLKCNLVGFNFKQCFWFLHKAVYLLCILKRLSFKPCKLFVFSIHFFKYCWDNKIDL